MIILWLTFEFFLNLAEKEEENVFFFYSFGIDEMPILVYCFLWNNFSFYMLFSCFIEKNFFFVFSLIISVG